MPSYAFALDSLFAMANEKLIKNSLKLVRVIRSHYKQAERSNYACLLLRSDQ